jgi:hypothetical protein
VAKAKVKTCAAKTKEGKKCKGKVVGKAMYCAVHKRKH